MTTFLRWFVLTWSVCAAFGQKTPVPSPKRYPFTELIGILEKDGGPPKLAERVSVAQGFAPERDVPLSAAAKEAVRVSESWMTARQSPSEGKDGRVLYTFGAGLPTVVCAPLRICVVELQPGEKLVGEPHIGDSVRWVISPATAGDASAAVPMVVLKPTTPGLDTNLLLTTDRRAYYLRLVSKPEEYIARVAFAYPADEEAKWKAYLARDAEERRRKEAEASQVAPIGKLEDLYFDYRVYGGEKNTRPIRVVDDGKKTYIQMPPEAAHRELPMLGVVGPEGKAELVNYRVKGDTYIVDRLFDRGALILGVGKKANKAEIIRGNYGGKRPRGNPYVDLQRKDGAQ